MSDNVVSMFEELPKRQNATECLKSRMEELEEGDAFTDVLILTHGQDGLKIRTNCGGTAECVMLLEFVKHSLMEEHFYFGDDDDYEE